MMKRMTPYVIAGLAAIWTWAAQPVAGCPLSSVAGGAVELVPHCAFAGTAVAPLTVTAAPLVHVQLAGVAVAGAPVVAVPQVAVEAFHVGAVRAEVFSARALIVPRTLVRQRAAVLVRPQRSSVRVRVRN